MNYWIKLLFYGGQLAIDGIVRVRSPSLRGAKMRAANIIEKRGDPCRGALIYSHDPDRSCRAPDAFVEAATTE